MCGSDMKSSPGEVGWGEARSALALIISDRALKPNNPGGLAPAKVSALDRLAMHIQSTSGIRGNLPRPGPESSFPAGMFRSVFPARIPVRERYPNCQHT